MGCSRCPKQLFRFIRSFGDLHLNAMVTLLITKHKAGWFSRVVILLMSTLNFRIRIHRCSSVSFQHQFMRICSWPMKWGVAPVCLWSNERDFLAGSSLSCLRLHHLGVEALRAAFALLLLCFCFAFCVFLLLMQMCNRSKIIPAGVLVSRHWARYSIEMTSDPLTLWLISGS